MKSNSYGRFMGFTSFGESHGTAIGIVIEDVKPGIVFPLNKIQEELDARKPGKTFISTTRKEEDKIVILSGIFEGKTTGMPICLVVYNRDANSKDYEHLKDIFRPGHADFTYYNKFKIYDHRGGGRASGRETISRIAASGLVDDLLKNIRINVYPVQIGRFHVKEIDPDFRNDLNWFDRSNYNELTKYLTEIKKAGNSIGGIVEVKIENISSGLGDPVFEKLDANLAKAILSIGSVKGIEFGDGFVFAALKGDQANDQMDSSGFKSNHSGGILGGISTGQNIIFRFAVKPTSSINITQKTISKDGKEVAFKSGGRHDTCIVPRILPVAKAMIKLVLADAVSYQKLISSNELDLTDYREAVDKIDEDILIALKRRNDISELIKKYKKENQIKVEDNIREKKLLKNLIKKAKSLEISEEFIKEIWKIILKESKNIQS